MKIINKTNKKVKELSSKLSTVKCKKKKKGYIERIIR